MTLVAHLDTRQSWLDDSQTIDLFEILWNRNAPLSTSLPFLQYERDVRRRLSSDALNGMKSGALSMRDVELNVSSDRAPGS